MPARMDPWQQFARRSSPASVSSSSSPRTKVASSACSSIANGRREILIYDDDDPDACSENLELTPADTRTLSELLGGSTVTEAVTAVQQQIEGLAIEWIEIPARSATIGTTIGDGQFRTRTGSSIVAVIRHGDTTPAPGPEFEFAGGDVAVAVGTVEGLATLRDVMRR